MASQLNSAFEEVVNAGRLPGIGAVVLDKAGKSIYNQAFGKLDANDDSSKSFTNDTDIIMWSCTKLITSLCILQLLEKGEIASLDDPMSKYLPDDPSVRVYTGKDKDGKPTFREPKTPITLLHLITHTAGYGYDFWNDELRDYRIANEQPPAAYIAIGARWQINDSWLQFDPGQQYNYGVNIDKLGFIVEKLSGMNLAEYIKKNITDPLGMKRTGAKLNESEFLKVHMKGEDGKLTAVDAIKVAVDPEVYGGGHFIISTLNDYSKLLLTLLNDGTNPQNGGTILKPETVQKYVFKDMIPAVGCKADGIGEVAKSNIPGLSNAGEFMAGVSKGWSCGLMLNISDSPGGRKALSGAWAGLGNLYYWIDRSANVAGIIGTAVLPFLDPDAVSLFEKLEKFAYNGKSGPVAADVSEVSKDLSGLKV